MKIYVYVFCLCLLAIGVSTIYADSLYKLEQGKEILEKNDIISTDDGKSYFYCKNGIVNEAYLSENYKIINSIEQERVKIIEEWKKTGYIIEIVNRFGESKILYNSYVRSEAPMGYIVIGILPQKTYLKIMSNDKEIKLQFSQIHNITFHEPLVNVTLINNEKINGTLIYDYVDKLKLEMFFHGVKYDNNKILQPATNVSYIESITFINLNNH